nr:probable E3 ubiquitin-protein ligase bre1 isoform X1 [Lepeophtheirus salmonis]
MIVLSVIMYSDFFNLRLSLRKYSRFSSNKAAHSVPNLSHSSPIRQSSFQPPFSPPTSYLVGFNNVSSSSPPPLLPPSGKGGLVSPSLKPNSPSLPPLLPTRGSNTQLEKVEERIQGRGMCRSNASYGIQSLLQTQIENDSLKREAELARKEMEMKNAINKLTQSYEEKIKALNEIHSHKVQELNDAKQTSLINAKNIHETDLKHLSSTYEARILDMKRVHKVEVESLKSDYEKKIQAQKLDYENSISSYKERDDAWQLEKQDVFSEIQRLKDEANRFIAILSQEEDRYEDEEKMSPQKKQILQREIESLQLVIDMRTSEIHKLREEQTRHLQQLEEFEKTRSLLSKMQAKVEDLQAQLENKNVLQRQLSLEKSKLENSYEEETKKKARMSMQSNSEESTQEDVEELQWRIRNQYELPPTKILSPSTEQGGFLVYNDNDNNNNINRSNNINNNSVDSNDNTTPSKRITTSPNKRVILHHADNNNAKSNRNNSTGHAPLVSSSSQHRRYSSPPVSSSHGGEGSRGVCLSPSSKVAGSSPARPSTIRLDSTGSSLAPSPRADEEDDDDEILVIEKGEEDDEGLGDISSEASSPQPSSSNNKEREESHHNKNNNNNSNSSSNGKNDERVPSRIPLSLETNL